MADDARLKRGYKRHPKTIKLARRAGPWAALCFQELWFFCGDSIERCKGDLTGMTDEDIEIAADWDGEPGVFVRALVEVGYLDGEPGAYRIHDFEEHQPWIAGKAERSQAATLANLTRWHEDGRHGEKVPGCPRCFPPPRIRPGSEPDPTLTTAGSADEKSGVPLSSPLPSSPLPSSPLPSLPESNPDAGASERAPAKGKKTKATRDHRGMGATSVGPNSPSWWPPTSVRELCEGPIWEGEDEPPDRKMLDAEGRVLSCWRYWRMTFEAYDGHDGRETLKARVQEAWDFWCGDGRKTRWKTPAGFTASLRAGPPGRTYADALRSYQRTMREARGPTVNETPGDSRTRARVETERAHQQRNPHYVDPATRALEALRAGVENDDPEAAADGRALLRASVGIRDGPDSRRVVEALTGETPRGPLVGAREAEK